MALLQKNEQKLTATGASASVLRVHTLLQRQPMLTVKRALSLMGDAPTFATVNNAFGRLVSLGIVEEKTGTPRYRVFAYKEYLAILSEGTEPI